MTFSGPGMLWPRLVARQEISDGSGTSCFRLDDLKASGGLCGDLGKEGPGLWAPKGSKTICLGPKEPSRALEPLGWPSLLLGKEYFLSLPDCRAALP